MRVIPVPVLQDNYAYLVHHEGETWVVDPSEAHPIKDVLRQHGWQLSGILNTHHHWDHVGGNQELAALYGCKVWVPPGELRRIASADRELTSGECQLGKLAIEVIPVPGHTLTGVAIRMGGALFTGDTLFLVGCGRLFEGTATQMWQSLCRLASLPDSTAIYCGHEYAAANAEFALNCYRDPVTEERYRAILDLRKLGRPSVPGSLALEKATNPFLRVADPSYREKVFGADLSAPDAFAELRVRKDQFKSSEL